MRFKRPQVRYADTPQPATPYQSAAQVWDERIGSARVQAKNWRLMAFGCLTLALLMAGGLVWRSAQSIVTPYVIEVDQSGQVRTVGEAATPYRPADAQIAHHLARFVTLVRQPVSPPQAKPPQAAPLHRHQSNPPGPSGCTAASNSPMPRPPLPTRCAVAMVAAPARGRACAIPIHKEN